jgi:hypothetical protein
VDQVADHVARTERVRPFVREQPGIGQAVQHRSQRGRVRSRTATASAGLRSTRRPPKVFLLSDDAGASRVP